MKEWPFGAALRGEAPNRLMLRWLKTVVVSDEEKAPERRQVGAGKTTVAETSKPERWCVLRDKPGGCPSTGQAASGVEMA
jgi:hypothetical protein